MIGMQNRNAKNIDRPSPGCLGQMVNLFDTSNGISGKRLLTDKPHFDGSSFSRSRSGVTRVLSPADEIEDKMMVADLRRSYSNKKVNGTPMKTLIAQEMSKEVESKHNPPNVVAKLMGLDTLPVQLPNSGTRGGHMKGYSRRSLSHSGVLMESWEQDLGILEKQMHCEAHHCHEQNQQKDVPVIWQQPQEVNARDSSAQKGRYNENVDEKGMALIRQKFMEAKCLAADCQSKEFREAIDVLSSNRDLLLKFLEKPNSMFSRSLYHMESIPPASDTKHITVLKPTKLIDNEKVMSKKSDKQVKKTNQMGYATDYQINGNSYSASFCNQKVDDCPSQPTRIVVLKPSPGITRDCKAVVSPPYSSTRIIQCEDTHDKFEDDEARESTELATGCQIPSDVRDETLLSSVFSNGYIGDDSSFDKSEIEYADGNLTESEIISPTSRHSWDYINEFGSPYSSASCSRVSCSPESSVCREAKKRLSERWAMMTLNGSSQEQKDACRSSSTLGDMLALSDVKCAVRLEGEISNKQQEPRGSTCYLTSDLNKEEGVARSPKNLLRSKSLPVSSAVLGARINVDISDPEAGKMQVPKEVIESKSSKSSFKGRVSSLFFSRNKRRNEEKSARSQIKDELQATNSETLSSPVHLPGKLGGDVTQCANTAFEVYSSGLQGSSIKTTNPDLMGMETKEGLVSKEHMENLQRVLSVAKPLLPGNASENQDQPSPISVLEPLFEEDNIIPEACINMKSERRGVEIMSPKSNLIDKSPLIGSISRTLLWDDIRSEMGTPFPLNRSLAASVPEEAEQDLFSLVQTLISAAGLEDKVLIHTFYAGWHSAESPLDPSLREKYANLNDKELLHEAKRRQRRSNRKLVFDCVNAAIVEFTSYGSDRSTSCKCQNRTKEASLVVLVDHVWSQIKEWISMGDDGDSNSLVVEKGLRSEVVGKGWADNMIMELDNLGREIEGKLIEDLVEEAVVNFVG
ncbi:hypothetical protein K2173_012765 [Erythroxylum novogranatense]|uniref:DUF4378 domain-containing protein n=1 Tax=Erythroxylum novogranatense TaxID=1862640 RepID=A0AAV8UEI1_9ROSI|nr:hypothetical protein K2173_012765 [Erythroxylum novogranatense]